MSFDFAGLCFTTTHGATIRHDHALVALSYIVAVCGSFAAREMVERWRSAQGITARYWQAAASIAFGSSIWSMHFIGILALRMAFPVTYAPAMTIFSLLIAIVAVGLGLEIIRSKVTWQRGCLSGMTVGLGIAAAHYVGMAGVRFAGSLAYTPTLWGLSLLVAVAAATGALWLTLRLKQRWQRGLGALVMGGAICATHYTGMAAAVFRVDPAVLIAPGLTSGLPAIAVALITLALVLCTLVLVAVDRRRFESNLRHAAMLQSSYNRLAEINTEQEIGRQLLDEKSRLLEMTLQHMSQGIVMTDADHIIQVSNRRMAEMFDLPSTVGAERPDKRSVQRFLWERGEFGTDDADFDAWLARINPTGDLDQSARQFEHRRPNGTVLEIRIQPLPGGGNVQTCTDITRRSQAEDAMRAARDEADRSARAKSDFLAMMSHEIRSPMSGLVGVLDLLRETKLDRDQVQMADMVHGSAMVLLAVLNDILDFSKIEAGGILIALEPTPVCSLVNTVAKPHLLEARRKGVELRLRYGSALPDYATVDPLRLTQILNNLLSNAVKFTASGAIELAVDSAPDGPDPCLRFTVSDSGIGMTTETIARLFEPFVQADVSTTRSFGGSGLGLCISRRLAGLMSGTLTAARGATEGSIFTLLLPLIVADVPAAVCPAAVVPQPSRLTGAGRVLVVDDDLTNRWISQRQLEFLGWQVDTAENGETALQMLRSGHYNLLLTDCHMPRMDGVALTRAVRTAGDPMLRGLPIIGLTADVTAEQRERCLDAGMADTAIKPLSRAHLSRLLAGHLGAAAPADSPTPASGSPAAPLFDDGMYHELFLPGDPEGEEWLAAYLAGAEELDDELGQLLSVRAEAAGWRAGVAAAAHRLAGASLSAGAMRLGERARAIEQAAAREPLATLQARHTVLRNELAAAKLAISAFLTSLRLELMA